MGQYHIIANLDKKEWLHPHDFGCGIKLAEFAFASEGPMAGLALLLASSNGMGGGDIFVEDEFDDIPGRWAGDRIVIAGDYDVAEGSPGMGIYQAVNAADPTPAEIIVGRLEGEPCKPWVNISARTLCALWCDTYHLEVYQSNCKKNQWLRKQMIETWSKGNPDKPCPF